MNDVVILGAGGFAREVLWVFEDCNLERRTWNVLGFIDENPEAHGQIVCELPVLGGFEWFKGRKSHPCVVSGTGLNAVRRKFAQQARDLGLTFCSVRHPSVRASRFVTVGVGSVICAGSTLTTQIAIGDHVNINLHCTIGHDVVIGSYCNLSPGVHLSGHSHLEEGVDLGTGCVVIPGKRIGRNSIVGAGAVVTSDIPENSVAVGIPAKVIRSVAKS